jgi:hypothetical protein
VKQHDKLSTTVQIINAVSDGSPMRLLAAVIDGDFSSNEKEVLISYSRTIADKINGEMDEAFNTVATRCLIAELLEDNHNKFCERHQAAQAKRKATIAAKAAKKGGK